MAAPVAPKWKDNPGKLPRGTAGKRVVVELENGSICGCDPVTSTLPAGWAADGKQGCCWEIKPGWPFNIRRYYVL